MDHGTEKGELGKSCRCVHREAVKGEGDGWNVGEKAESVAGGSTKSATNVTKGFVLGGFQLADEAGLTFVGAIPNSRGVSENREDARPVEEAKVGLREASDSVGKDTKTGDDGGGASTQRGILPSALPPSYLSQILPYGNSSANGPATRGI